MVSRNRQRIERRRRKAHRRLIGRRPAWERLEPRIISASNLSLVQDDGEATLEYGKTTELLTLTQGQSVLTADPANGVVIIQGTAGDDHFKIGEIPVDAEVWFQGGVGDDILARMTSLGGAQISLGSILRSPALMAATNSLGDQVSGFSRRHRVSR